MSWRQTVDTRLADLRADLRVVGADVSTLKADAATIKERVSHLPTKGFIVAVTLTSLAVASALTAFAPRLQHLFGAG